MNNRDNTGNNIDCSPKRQSSINEELIQIEEFFNQMQKPSNLESIRTKVAEFCQRHAPLKIGLITVMINY